MGNTQYKGQFRFHYLNGEKFKTNVIGLLIRTPLSRKNVSKTALIAELLKNGCKAYPSRQEVAIKMEELYGGVFDISLLKKGDEQILFFYLEFLNNDELTEECCDFLQQYIALPLAENGAFSKNLMDREKESLRKKIQSRKDDKREYAKEKCIELLGSDKGDAYGLYADGYEEDLDGISGEELFSHYEYIMENSPIELLFCGNKNIAKTVKEKLCGFDFSNSPSSATVTPLCHCKPVGESETMDLAQGRLCMGFTSEIPPASPKFYSLLLANELLGGGASSLLFSKMREERGLCYYISSSLQRIKSVLLVQTGIAPNDYKEAVSCINAACNELAEGNIDKEQLSNSKESLIRYYTAMEDSQAALMNWKTDQIILGTEDSIAKACKYIEDATATDVAAIAAALKFSASYFLTSSISTSSISTSSILNGKEAENNGNAQAK